MHKGSIMEGGRLHRLQRGIVTHSRWKPRQMLSPHQPMASTLSGRPSSFNSTNSFPACMRSPS